MVSWPLDSNEMGMTQACVQEAAGPRDMGRDRQKARYWGGRKRGIEKQNRIGPRKTGTKTERQRREIEMNKI